MASAKPATIVPWPGWVFEGSGDLPRCLRRWWFGNRRGGSRPVAIGSQSIGVSLQPAIPRRVAPQQSPPPLHRSPTTVAQSRSAKAVKRPAQIHRKDVAQLVILVPVANRSVISTLHARCHLYLAPTDTSKSDPRSCQKTCSAELLATSITSIAITLF